MQAYRYYESFPDDSRFMKCFVAVLWTLDFTHLVLVSYVVYYYLVANWGNPAVISCRFIVPLRIHLFLIALLTLLSQLFFLFRIWTFSEKNYWIAGPVFVCILGTFGVISITGIFVTIQVKFPLGTVLMVTFGAFTDICIAALLCFYLRKRSKPTRQMSMLIIACLIAYFTAQGTYIAIALHFSSGRTYANAVLVNLNVRRKLRDALERMEPSFASPSKFDGALDSAVVSS
ncbi:hypothetical protein NP233_g12438 [Leucocoprinus birnbaumii]|uniref:DUF6534 domain-containing protein n=1 Tax=Leucocoprinus birnbaumii TaxID=56174 RepID=A0AAD5VF24_9AGAR|nr:hypothetical protein NP233_g12438 [Leucocoprinus birnbaumii]